MGWRGKQYSYSIQVLRAIAVAYLYIYDGLPLSITGVVSNPWLIAEYKADFDRALRGIGTGKWSGNPKEFKYYRSYGNLQRIIIADILDIPYRELERLRFYEIPRLRWLAYRQMKIYLNGGEDVNENNA